MQLGQLLNTIYPEAAFSALKDFDIQDISCDSRTVGAGDLFVAVAGPQHDGHQFVKEALLKGAVVVVNQNFQGLDSEIWGGRVLRVPDTQSFLRQVAPRFYDYPAQKMKIVGVTGTNGKTTTTYLLESILTCAQKSCAVIGTVNYRFNGKVVSAKNTTPGFLDNQRYWAAMAAQKVEYCLMEVSSHALDQDRVNPQDFQVAVFTNLTGDHLDYHQTMENYFRAKSKLFFYLAPQSLAVINQDDPYGHQLMAKMSSRFLSYGLLAPADVTASRIRLRPQGSDFILSCPAGSLSVSSALIGRHNMMNILAAAAAAQALGIPLSAVKAGVESLRVVPGRLERVATDSKISVFVDYAHTHDALEKVLLNLRDICSGRLLLVFGCGGDRDRVKRPKMGHVASTFADFSFITSDNPRSEDPEKIAQEVLGGFQSPAVKIILDRQEAIAAALAMAQEGDFVLIAGKGHEDYQIFKDRTIAFDDRQVAQQFLSC